MEHAYFLLRDGELFYNVYQALFHDKPDACKVSTLASSRRAMLLPIVELAPAFAIPSLMGGIGMRPMREYIERLGIKADAFEAEAIASGFTSLDEEIDGRLEGNRLLRFLVRHPVITAMLQKGKEERDALAAYLQQEQVLSRSKVALIDLGWAGTIQQSLQVLLSALRPQAHVTGYYMATFAPSPHGIPNVDLRSYLAHRGSPSNICNHIGSFLNLFEAIYTSAEGSLLRFEVAEDGSTVAVRQPNDKPLQQLAHLERMHAGVLAFVEDYCRLNQSHPPSVLLPEAAAEEIFRVIARPTAQEATLLGGLVHCDNLGSLSTHVSASAEISDDPAALLAAYKDAHWRRGFLSLPTPQTAALRTLLWLEELQLSHEIPA